MVPACIAPLSASLRIGKRGVAINAERQKRQEEGIYDRFGG
jgi:hypothetical protein